MRALNVPADVEPGRSRPGSHEHLAPRTRTVSPSSRPSLRNLVAQLDQHRTVREFRFRSDHGERLFATADKFRRRDHQGASHQQNWVRVGRGLTEGWWSSVAVVLGNARSMFWRQRARSGVIGAAASGARFGAQRKSASDLLAQGPRILCPASQQLRGEGATAVRRIGRQRQAGRMNASTAFLDSAARRHFPCISGHAGRPTSKDGLRSRPCVALDEELLLGSRRVRLVGVRNRQGCEYTFLFVGSITNADQPLVRVIDLERILIEGGRPHSTPEVLVGVSPPFSAHTSEATDIARRLLRGRPDIQPTPAGAWSVHVPRRWSIGPLAGRDVRTEIFGTRQSLGPPFLRNGRFHECADPPPSEAWQPQ